MIKNLSVIISLTHLVTMIQILFLNQMLLQFGALARMNMKFFKKLNLFMNHKFHIVTYPLKNKGTAFTISVSKDIERLILNDKFNKSFLQKLPVHLKNLLLHSKDPIVRKTQIFKVN